MQSEFTVWPTRFKNARADSAVREIDAVPAGNERSTGIKITLIYPGYRSDSSNLATSGSGKDIFVRQATGLVRQISGLEALGMCVTQMGLLYVFNVVAFTPAFYPDANPLIGPLIGFLLVLPIAGVYILFSIGIPRTGGDYVWVSRVTNPGIGFVSNFALTLIVLSVVGAVAPWIGQWSFGEMFYDSKAYSETTPITSALPIVYNLPPLHSGSPPFS